MRRSRFAFAVALFCLGIGPVSAGPTTTLTKTRLAASKAVVPGVWHADLNKCKAYAKEHSVPLIAVWSNGDLCGHCVSFETAATSTTFKNWMKTSGCVFYFACSSDSFGQANGTAYNFCWGPSKALGEFPFVRIWWYTKTGAKKLDTSVVGDKIDGGYGGSTGGKNAVAWFKSKLKNFKPGAPVVVPKYTGGEFGVGDTETARLEAIAGVTADVVVPLTRTNVLIQSSASTNLIVVSGSGGAAVTNRVDWDAGQSESSLTVDTSALTQAGAVLELKLLDVAGAQKAVTHITAVAEPENSPSNPYWIGERTAEELAWGEWTMDIDVATNKVAAFNGGAVGMSSTNASPRAYTFVLLEGCLWCGDCKKTDPNLLERVEFRNWAQSNRVALVVIDLARGDATSKAATLLSDEPGGSSAASGSAYLSRKGIDRDAAAAVLKRNFDIAQRFRLPNWSNVTRPPVPSFFILRDDGSIGARMQYFGGVESPTAFNDAYITRLNELLAQLDDPEEESNDNDTWTKQMICKRASVESQISFTDAADVWKLNPEETAGKRIRFSVTGTAASSVVLKVWGEGVKTASTVAALNQGGGELSVDIPLTATNCFVSVAYEQDARGRPVDPYFAVTNAVSTVCPFTLSTDFVVIPVEIAEEVTIEGSPSMMVELVSNQVYRITGLGANAESLEPVEGTSDRYRAMVSGATELQVSATVCSVQLWNPGTVGFVAPSGSTTEASSSYMLRLVRSGGVSGVARARVTFNAEKSSSYDSLYRLPDGFDEEIVWEEGDAAEKTVEIDIIDNDFADGDQTLCFDVAVTGDAGPGLRQFRLTIRDNDRKVPGRIAVTKTDPSFAKPMTVLARQGATLAVKFSRQGGSDGVQTVDLNASAGALDTSSLIWENRDTTERMVAWQLPAAGRTATLAMTPAKGSAVDAARRVVTVNLLASDVPGFAADVVSVSGTRYVPLAPVEVAVADENISDWSTVRVTKYSGALPAGLTWKFDAATHRLIVSGVPTKAGTATAVFRVSCGAKAGLTTAVTVSVTDPVVAGAGESGAAALNASVEKTRTYSDVPVLDATTKRLTGLLTVTVPRTGRLSAKYRSIDAVRTATFSCRNWAGIAGDGTLSAVLTGMIGTNPCELEVSAAADGSVAIALADPFRAGDTIVCDLPVQSWSAGNPATDFKGFYTVSLPQKAKLSGFVLAAGDAFVTLKMTTASAINGGRFTYAGVLPNGKAFSGSCVAIAKDRVTSADFDYWKRAVLPLFSVATSDTLAGAVQLTPGAADKEAQDVTDESKCDGRCWYRSIRRSVHPVPECDFWWRHVEKAEEASCEVLFDVYGGYYNSAEDFASLCQSALGTTRLSFFALDGMNSLPEEIVDSLRRGLWVSQPTNRIADVTVSYALPSKTAKTKTSRLTSSSTTRLPLSFSLSTGLVSGSFSLVTEGGAVTMTYRGVVMPGWGSQDCIECGVGGAEAALRPFISGTAWFNDTLEHVDAAGRERTLTVRRSTPFSVGVNPGE